jgi:CRP/FNR family transcriptional regulator
LTPDELAELAQISTAIQLDAGQTLFEQGEEAVSVYNVTAGPVRLSKTLAGGRRQIMGFMLPGDFIGLSSRTVHPYSAEAVLPSRLCRFNASTLRQIAERMPHLEHELFTRARDELDAAHDQIMLLGRKSPREKVATFLLDLARRRERWGQRSDRVRLDMTRGDIGDYLGLTLETVSRTLNRMKREGIIALPSAAEVVFLKAGVILDLAERD